MKYNALLNEYQRKLEKALEHLKYSYNKVQHLFTDTTKMDDETLETWESFAVRFARVADLFLTKYIRTKILIEDPGFSGTFRDFVNQAEKLGLLNDVTSWMAIRELRNTTAHEYSEEDLSALFERLRKECPRLISIKL